MLAAVFAAVSHWLVVFALGNAYASAVWTVFRFAPTVVFKVQTSSVLVWELLEELIEADRFRLVHAAPDWLVRFNYRHYNRLVKCFLG